MLSSWRRVSCGVAGPLLLLLVACLLEAVDEVGDGGEDEDEGSTALFFFFSFFAAARSVGVEYNGGGFGGGAGVPSLFFHMSTSALDGICRRWRVERANCGMSSRVVKRYFSRVASGSSLQSVAEGGGGAAGSQLTRPPMRVAMLFIGLGCGESRGCGGVGMGMECALQKQPTRFWCDRPCLPTYRLAVGSAWRCHHGRRR